MVDELILGRYRPIYSAVYEGDTSLPSHLKMTENEIEDVPMKIVGFYAGPIMAKGQVYDQRHPLNIRAGIAKNLADQVVGPGLPKDIVALFIDQHSVGIGAKDSEISQEVHMYSDQEVIDAAYLRSGKKGRQYNESFINIDNTGVERSDHDTWNVRHFVKFEFLKFGKPPRLVCDASTDDVVMGRRTGKGFEAFIAENLSIKGLQSDEKWKPLEEVQDLLGEFYVIALDDTARDANTVQHDFDAFIGVLDSMDLLDDLNRDMLDRTGFRSNCGASSIASKQVSLLSGVDFTSSMNYNTTRLNCWFIAHELGLDRLDWAVIAEGDDCLFCIRLSIWYTVKDRFATVLSACATMLRKDLKIEGQGEWDECGHPFVGSHMGYYAGRWWCFPSFGRMKLKSTVVLGHDVQSATRASGRLKARAEALSDRYSGVPIGYKLAEVLRHRAMGLRGKILRTTEEEYHLSLSRKLFREPNNDEREAYAHCVGIEVVDQLLLESEIEMDCARENNPDMREHFEILL